MKKIVSLFCAAAMVLSMAACSGGSNTAGTEDGNATVVKYSVVFASSGTQADGAAVLSDLIEEHSDGRLKMEFYPSSQLVDKIATFE